MSKYNVLTYRAEMYDWLCRGEDGLLYRIDLISDRDDTTSIIDGIDTIDFTHKQIGDLFVGRTVDIEELQPYSYIGVGVKLLPEEIK